MIATLAGAWAAQAACIPHVYTFDQAANFCDYRGQPRLRNHPDVAAALAICKGCAVKAPCLEWALAEGIGHGVLGGTLPEQRMRTRRRR